MYNLPFLSYSIAGLFRNYAIMTALLSEDGPDNTNGSIENRFKQLKHDILVKHPLDVNRFVVITLQAQFQNNYKL